MNFGGQIKIVLCVVSVYQLKNVKFDKSTFK